MRTDGWQNAMKAPARRHSVLIIEDHRDVAEMLGTFLERRGFRVDYAGDGVTGLHLAVTETFDTIVLDRMLPGIDGLEVCRRLREDARRSVPILMLTALDTLGDKIEGLEVGADDYLVKPFEVEELEARLCALIRRQRRLLTPELLRVADLVLDPATLRVSRGGIEIAVTPIGFKFLALLMRASPRVVGRREVEAEIWGDTPPDSDALRTHLYALRKAVDRPFDTPLISTVHSAGFRLAAPNE